MTDMNVTYIDHMGTDLSVVNAARVSFSKRHETFQDKKDTRLIHFLHRKNHFMPFTHTSLTVHVKAPVFVARQLAKHQIGLNWSESSRRYVKDTPAIFQPSSWRAAAEEVKQGSDQERVITSGLFLDAEDGAFYYADPKNEVRSHSERSVQLYEDLLESGVCPEQARMVLPQSMMTEWYWTGNVSSFGRMYDLRSAPDTQLETRIIAEKLSDIIRPHFPICWRAITSQLL